jgi:uncharacterized repeat protein (TIGR02543 family)
MIKQLVKIMLLLAMVCGASGAPYAQAATVTLPKTGQTVCYDAANAPTSCSNTAGQDANKLKGADWPVPRFIGNMKSDGVTSNGTITDDLTGLVWLKDAGCFATVGGIAKGTDAASSYLTWPNALTWSATLKNGDCTLSDGSVAGDWRLPSRKELQSLMDWQNANPALSTDHPFGNVQSYYYWSSSTYAGYTVLAWYVDVGDYYMRDGRVGVGVKYFNCYVWPVRGGQFGDSVTLVLPVLKDFGNVAVTGSSSQTFTISNTGAASRLQINAMVLSGTNADQFALNVGDGTAGSCGSKTPIIAPGGNCTVSVAFSPGSVGAKAASLRISGSDVTTPNVDIVLSGTKRDFIIGTSVVGGNGDISCTSPIASGGTSNCTISNITAGYHLATFTDDTEDKLASVVANAYSITNVTADHAIAGTFAINNYSVSFTSNGGTAVGSQTVAYNAATTAPTAPTKTGSTFAGWYSDAALTVPFVSTTAITADITLYAKWTLNNYTVSYTSNGGTVVSNQSVAYNTATTAPTAPTKTGSTFAGWYSDSVLTTPFVFTTAITADITLYAKWTINNYNVSYSSNGGTLVSNQSVAYNTATTAPTAPTKTGSTFAGWYSDISLATPFAFTTAITGDITLYAKWTINNYVVSYSSNGGTVVSNQYVVYNTATTAPTASTKTGSTFAGWYTDAGLTAAFAFTTAITGDITLYAKWTLNNYTVIFSSNGGSTVTSQSVAYNTATTAPTAPTKTGSTFAGWYSDISLATPFVFTTAITADTTLYAKWTLNNYTVIYTSNGGSTVGSQSVAYNTATTAPTAPTKTGSTFAGWYIDAGLTTPFAFATAITADTTLYAKWTLNNYSVIFSSNGGSTVTSQSVAYNTATTAPPAPTKTGNTFAGWYTDAGLTTAFVFTTAITTDTTLYAKWTINNYTVIYTSNGGTVVSSQSVAHNTATTAPTTPTKTGSTFAGWYSDISLATPFVFTTAITADTTLYAKWTINNYNVSYSSNGGSMVTSQSVAYNTQTTAPSAPTKTGSTFAGWYSDAGLTTTFAFTTAITADITLYAKWTVIPPTTYSVSFTSNGGSAVSSQSVTENTTATAPTAPTKTGSTFAGWFSDIALANAFAFTTAITANTTLYAKWTVIPLTTYSVSFTSNGGSAVSNQTVTENTTATAPTAPTKTGYTFAGWFSDIGLANAFAFTTTITANTTLYAKWTVIPPTTYSVSFTSNGGSAVSNQTVTENTTATAPTAPTKTGNTFAGWFSDTALTAAFVFTTPITANTTLYAKWTVIPPTTYSVSFTSNGGSAVSNQTVTENTTATAPAIPTKSGYTFAGWYSDTALTAAFAFTTPITANTTLYAKWTVISPTTYSVSFTSNGGSAVSNQTVTENTTATAPTAPTKTGNTFAGWFSDTALTAAFVFTTPITANTTLYAKWTVIPPTTYSVSFTSNGGSAVSNQTVTENTTATAPTAPTKTGNTFAGWFSDIGLANAFAFTTPITANTTLYAKWTVIPPTTYTVSYTSNGGSAVSNQTVTENTTATAPTAPTRTGYTFAGWFSDISLTNAFAFTTKITANTTLYAKWTANVPTTYSVTPSAGTGSSMLPTTVQTITSGATTSFTITPLAGYGILSVTGCNGTLSGSTYTTGAITGNCSVITTAVKRNSNSGATADPTIADALKALQAFSGIVSLTPEETIRYDIAPLAANGVPQGNGAVDIADVIMILRRSIGIGSW